MQGMVPRVQKGRKEKVGASLGMFVLILVDHYFFIFIIESLKIACL